ncbi:MAG: hypothetical protein LBJ43_03790 [Propionibacteriaceae bacterium]|jgi:hypothetical protein|nr:hypothetical protein [Propionibacteriaceae bacterium]
MSDNVVHMSIGGMVFCLIAVAWLAYLLPWFLRNRTEVPMDDSAADLGEQMHYVQYGREALPPPALSVSDSEVSTPLLRSAARHQIANEARTAVRRRRIGLIANLLLLIVTAVLPFFVPVTSWLRLVGPLALVGWVVISRASVVIVGKQLRERALLLERGSEEATVAVTLAENTAPDSNELSVELSGVISPMASLLEPIEITPPTYLNRPLLPRSVRQIDLMPPSLWKGVPFVPLNADTKQEALPDNTVKLAALDGSSDDSDDIAERAVGE